MTRRPWFVVLVIALAYGCASMPGTCEPGDARLHCVPELGPATRSIAWGF